MCLAQTGSGLLYKKKIVYCFPKDRLMYPSASQQYRQWAFQNTYNPLNTHTQPPTPMNFTIHPLTQ